MPRLFWVLLALSLVTVPFVNSDDKDEEDTDDGKLNNGNFA